MKEYLINTEIQAEKLLVIDENGNKIGIFNKLEALKLGEEKGKDIVQIGYNQKDGIAIVKLIEYGKFIYENKKQDKEKKKGQKVKGLKEIKISYNIGKNDLQLKIKKIEESLKEGYTVKILIELKGREKLFSQIAVDRLKEIIQTLSDIAKSQEIKEEKMGFSCVLYPKVK